MTHRRQPVRSGTALITAGTLALALAGCSQQPTATTPGVSPTAPSQSAPASTTTGTAGTSSTAGTISTAGTTSTPGTTSTGTSSAAGTASAVPVESAPPGDIPDNVAFVSFTSAAGRYTFRHPEGWAQTGTGAAVRFTDKLNGVAVDSVPASSAPTVSSVRGTEVGRLAATAPAFELRTVSALQLPGGSAVRVVFRRNSDPDPVTGKVYRDEFQEYLIYRAGRLVRLQLFGPVGADNVDAYRTMSESVRIR